MRTNCFIEIDAAGAVMVCFAMRFSPVPDGKPVIDPGETFTTSQPIGQ
jgi:hypothetical protein